MAPEEPQFTFPDEIVNAANPPADGLTPAEMIELNLAHARRLFAHDYDAIREKSLIEHPVYESFPQSVLIDGIDAVRARHEASMFKDPDTLDSLQIRSVSFGYNTLVIEWSREHTFPDGNRRRCHAIAVVPFEDGKLTGERVYTDKHLAALMDETLGPEYYERDDVRPI